MWRTLILMAIWLGLALGCKQASPFEGEQLSQPEKATNAGPVVPTTNPNTCDDGTCCGEKGTYYRYRETYSGDTVILTGRQIEFKKPIPTGTDQTYWVYAENCPLSGTTVLNFIQQVLGKNDFQTSIRCKIWGRLYTTDKIIGTVSNGPSRYVAVDRIEAIK